MNTLLSPITPAMTVRQARLRPPIKRHPIVAQFSSVLKAGAYTQITSINAPSEADPGSLLMMSVSIRNTFVTSINVACVAQVNGQSFIDSGAEDNWISPGGSHDFSGQYVTMPDHDLVVDAWSYFLGTDGQWYGDDYMQITIKKTTLAGWQKLATQNVQVAVNQIAGWQKLATQNVNVVVNQIAGWEKFATTNTPVGLAPLAGWQKLATQNVQVDINQIAGWEKIATTNVPVALAPVAGWQKLGTMNVDVGVAEIGGWQKLATKEISIAQGFEIPAGYSIVLNQTTPDGKTYSGAAQRSVCSFKFLPASWPGASWFTQKLIVDKLAAKVQENGQKLLTAKLYESGFSYFLVMETTNTATGYRVLAQVVIAAIVIAALVLAIAITLTVAVHIVTDFAYKAPGAAISLGLILLGVVGAGVLGLAIWKGSSVKQAVTGSKSRQLTKPASKAATKSLVKV